MSKNATIFLGGHGLGGLTSQILAYPYKNEIFGQILILERKYQSTNSIYPVSTLILSGELDGLTRIIESFYFYSTYPHFTINYLRYESYEYYIR